MWPELDTSLSSDISEDIISDYFLHHGDRRWYEHDCKASWVICLRNVSPTNPEYNVLFIAMRWVPLEVCGRRSRVVSMLSNPGDIVICEEWTYPSAVLPDGSLEP